MLAETLENSKFLVSLYGPDFSFSDVDLQEIRLGWDGPIAHIVFSLSAFPVKPPEKWRGLNAVQVELSLFPLHDVAVTKFARGNKCSIDIEHLPDGLYNVLISGESTASAKVASVSVDKVSAYLRGS